MLRCQQRTEISFRTPSFCSTALRWICARRQSNHHMRLTRSRFRQLVLFSFSRSVCLFATVVVICFAFLVVIVFSVFVCLLCGFEWLSFFLSGFLFFFSFLLCAFL